MENWERRNWLAYHIATTLALEGFLSEAGHCEPYLQVYDQPSQVNFHKRTGRPP
ncbi:DUF3732 domain-containing protein [uncultured Bradyrhizobium sp.]|uniref:DUF3732 domain-containing protein n=1 Tax=uncultured Bradyrhizobium sp. TaxID=199684 RepID=UPI0035CC2998